MFSLSDIGLLMDIAGAYLLAQGLIFKPLAASLLESRSVWGRNVAHLKSLREQVYEARAGLAILPLGFFGQLVGAHYHISIGSQWFFICVVVLFVISWFVHVLARKLASVDAERANTP